MKASTASTYLHSFIQSLSEVYPVEEATAITQLLAHELLHDDLTKLRLSQKTLRPEQTELFEGYLKRLLKHEPVQYIMGYTMFNGLRFEVNRSTLIPRPETEELVGSAVKNISLIKENQSIHALDIGTGSGCIAISLKHALPGLSVQALDVSEPALQTAKRNAMHNHTHIDFIRHDILNEELPFADFYFDLILSNPPYIPEKERPSMAEHVVSFEPETALFVPDRQPLVFYEAILNSAEKKLKPGGYLMVEIHQAMGAGVAALFRNHRYLNIEIRNDLSGNPRFVSGLKS